MVIELPLARTSLSSVDFKTVRLRVSTHENPHMIGSAVVCTVQVDALVVGAHGMGAFKAGTSAAARIGSVSHACVEQAPCPVVVARFPPATAR